MMHHLTTDEILDFVSITDCSSESMRKCAAVTEHIRDCEQCLRLVQAFQRIRDAFEDLGVDMEFHTYARMYGREHIAQQEPETERERSAAADKSAPER